MEYQDRTAPIIVITGTPGTGKTTHAQLLVQSSPVPLKHINVGDLVKEKGLYESYDDEWQSYIVDDDKVIDEIEIMVPQGGLILDWHTCDTFPERWADLVVVLRTNHTQLWGRLEQRSVHLTHFCAVHVNLTGSSNYPLKKIQENNESEIMQTVLEDARASYPAEIVVEMRSETLEDLESNVSRIVQWIEAWQRDHRSGI